VIIYWLLKIVQQCSEKDAGGVRNFDTAWLCDYEQIIIRLNFLKPEGNNTNCKLVNKLVNL
jgi:hypothetical protein